MAIRALTHGQLMDLRIGRGGWRLFFEMQSEQAVAISDGRFRMKGSLQVELLKLAAESTQSFDLLPC